MTPVLAASTLIVMGDVEEVVLDLDGKDVIFVYPIVGQRLEDSNEITITQK